MKIVLYPTVDPSIIDKLVLKHHPSHMLATPTHYDVLLSSQIFDESTDLSFIKMMGIGGDGLLETTENRLNSFLKEHNCENGVIKGYGMTEVSAAACANRPENNALGSVGLPFYRVVISAFEQNTDKELKTGEMGELCIYSPSTMIGYYNRPEETDAILWTHSDGMKWVHSGDMGYIAEDGNVYIKGRIKRMIIRHDGFKVFPVQIESIITSCQKISACCVIAVQDQEHSQGSLPFVFAVPYEEYFDLDQVLVNELSELCYRKLPEYAQPHGYSFIKSLPLTPIGKIDYRKLEEMHKEM
jgi:long-chain acyl-CoA synthetase